jgi:hypothetical protein
MLVEHYDNIMCLRFGPIQKILYVFCDLSVRKKDWRSRKRGAQAT